MLGRVKGFIRRTFNNEKHPAIHAWYEARDERKRQEAERRAQILYEKRPYMTYDDIEEEIGRQYREIFRRKLDWDNPKTFSEKIHVSKVYMATPEKTRLADKYLVREWVREKIGEQYLISLLGVYDSFDEIDFDALPDKFVMKCNHDCGSVTMVDDKSALDLEALKRKYDHALAYNFGLSGFQMHYCDIRPKIIIEQYMGDAINDYKFLCFDGKPYCCWVDFDRYTRHTRNIYDLNWELQPFTLACPNYDKGVERPQPFEQMKEIARELCKGFDHVRVDLYLVGGKIYCGEMTFTTYNGFGVFSPDEWDYKIGALWPFDNTIRKRVRATRIKP